MGRAISGLAAWLCALLACAPLAAQERYGAPPYSQFDAQGTWPAPVHSLAADDIPRHVVEFVPAGGPMVRFASRAGAWYALVHLPLVAAMPAQLWLWLPADARDVHVSVLDRPPGANPTASVPLPLRPVRTGVRVAFQSVPFALPVDGTAAGAFVLIEQWNPAGARPLPVWLQLRSLDGEGWGGAAYGYVAPYDGTNASRRERAPTLPLSPLQNPRYYSGGLIELPFGAGAPGAGLR